MKIRGLVVFLIFTCVVGGFFLNAQLQRSVQKESFKPTLVNRDVAVSISLERAMGIRIRGISSSKLRITVQNKGNVTLKNVPVSLYMKQGKFILKPGIAIREKPLFSKTLKILAPGESLNIHITPSESSMMPRLQGGKYRAIAVADPRNTIRESDEKNNFSGCDYLVMSRITKVQDTPTGESYGGELFPEITIYGNRFGSPGSQKKVHLGEGTPGFLPAFSHDWKDTSIFMDLGPIKACGIYKVYLSEFGVRISNRVDFLLQAWITEIMPMAGAAPGAEVEIHGRNFGITQDGRIITFGSTVATVVSWSYSNIHVQVPALTPGNYEVRIKKGGVDYSGVMDYKVL